MKRSTKETIEQLANSVRVSFGIALPVTDVKQQLERNGISVIYTNDGMPRMVRHKDNHVDLYVWKNGIKARENYMLASFLFDVVKMVSDGEYGEKYFRYDKFYSEVAHIFARSFLMPRLYFEEMVEKFTGDDGMTDIAALSEHFCLTRKTIIGRGNFDENC